MENTYAGTRLDDDPAIARELDQMSPRHRAAAERLWEQLTTPGFFAAVVERLPPGRVRTALGWWGAVHRVYPFETVSGGPLADCGYQP